MDYSIILIFILVTLAFIYDLYYTFFKRVNKFSDRELMQCWVRYNSPRKYFPKVTLNSEEDYG